MTDYIHVEDDPFNKVMFEQYAKDYDLAVLDIETTIVENPWMEAPTLVSVAVTFDGIRSFVFTGDEARKYKHLLENVQWTFHNGLFDRLMCLAFFNLDLPLAHDTMAMQYLLDPDEPKSLQVLSKKFLGLSEYKDVDYHNILDEPIEKVFQMNAEDVRRTWKIYRPLADQLNAQPALSKVYQWLLLPAIEELIQCTMNGVPLDADRLAVATKEAEVHTAALRVDLVLDVPDPNPEVYPKGWTKPGWWRIGKHGKYEYPGLFNPASSQQVAYLLFDEWALPPLEYTKDKEGNETSNPSTNKDVLLMLETYHTEGDQQQWLHDLRTYRQETKLLSYYTAWPGQVDEDGWLHPRYKPLHAVTGRTSSEKPNIQNIPRKQLIRAMFGGIEGYSWLKADYSQIELRVAAWVAQEATMLDAFRSGKDLHALTAEMILGDPTARLSGKVFNFGLIYGAGPATLQRIARSEYGVFFGRDEARRHRIAFFRLYPGLERWHSDMERNIVSTGMATSPLGRVRYLPNAKIPWSVEEMRGKKQSAIRQGINHPVQSFASDLLLHSLVELGPLARERDIKVVATVHDEIDFLVPHGLEEEWSSTCISIMEDMTWLQKWGIELDVPVVVDIEHGPYWGEVE